MRLDGVLALAVFTEKGLLVVTAETRYRWSLPTIEYVAADRDQTATLASADVVHRIDWDSRRDGRYFRETLTYWATRTPAEWELELATPRSAQMIKPESVTTLQAIPGSTTRRSLGIVTALSSNASWTATHKGSTALELAITELRTAAYNLGANAVVGLQVASFGAAGGITSVVGGDAVGILLMGTAVQVDPDLETADSGVPISDGARPEVWPDERTRPRRRS